MGQAVSLPASPGMGPLATHWVSHLHVGPEGAGIRGVGGDGERQSHLRPKGQQAIPPCFDFLSHGDER